MDKRSRVENKEVSLWEENLAKEEEDFWDRLLHERQKGRKGKSQKSQH